MWKYNEDFSYVRHGIQFIIFSMIFVTAIGLGGDEFYGVFGKENYVTIHLMMEIFIIVVTMSISIQTWLISPYILSNRGLYVGALFLTISFIEMAHTLSYKGMPFFITDNTPYVATWFYILGRLLLSMGSLLIFFIKEKEIKLIYRWFIYSLPFVIIIGCFCVLYAQTPILPPLMIEGEGPTVLKNTLQYTAVALQLVIIGLLFKNLKKAPKIIFLLLSSSIYLIMSDYLFTIYQDVYDIKNFIGHIFELGAYYFLFRAIYFSSIEKPFKQLIDTQEHLEKSREKMHYMAYHNEITNLPNERFLMETLKKDLYISKSQKAILAIGIERLSAIKASLGSTYADQMIGLIAQRLKNVLPEQYLLCMLREDYFVVYINEVSNTHQLTQLSQQLQFAMEESFQIQHFALNSQLNIGIALFPTDSYREEELIRFALYAMHEAQKTPTRIRFYESSISKETTERLLLENDLHDALANQELFLEYQPQLDLHTGQIKSVEALVRWQHPKKGWISPGVFIPIAEESGLIIPIGQWVLETACQQVKRWEAAGLPPIKVAVNLSLGQLFQQNLVEIIHNVLEKAQLEPKYLQLEITESMTINIDHMTTILHKLKALGVTIAVDDFGTGYSSLSYLKDFPIDCLKIDRSFVQKIQSNSTDKALVDMILSMAKHLQLKVVAEGIEEIEQLSYLVASQCDTVQGFLFSKPVSPRTLQENYQTLHNEAKYILDSIIASKV
ncbi:EAL domain-containing protein [Lysinibacillus xylanilyticus]|uniref:bifunctional diguanylate cyclase/phosphodiesterase n=1 Tax=Lysinibacillus xylanilyticus TaxID=582475 RepID=UPI002B254FCF|nr:EAL domain-containing protein [Lysinibacillus xylanilyticus]MEB2302666.1 EAL domain-containing protein [Lysinibacillus xylanilyticus]